mmetsp:Transcript_22328/g.78244  ORF Transcript_22328/g.78244 Transcript_22328/m.78244 type:complete len:253 (-) Transcript_22328:1010-1768(-)
MEHDVAARTHAPAKSVEAEHARKTVDASDAPWAPTVSPNSALKAGGICQRERAWFIGTTDVIIFCPPKVPTDVDLAPQHGHHRVDVRRVVALELVNDGFEIENNVCHVRPPQKLCRRTAQSNAQQTGAGSSHATVGRVERRVAEWMCSRRVAVYSFERRPQFLAGAVRLPRDQLHEQDSKAVHVTGRRYIPALLGFGSHEVWRPSDTVRDDEVHVRAVGARQAPRGLAAQESRAAKIADLRVNGRKCPVVCI